MKPCGSILTTCTWHLLCLTILVATQASHAALVEERSPEASRKERDAVSRPVGPVFASETKPDEPARCPPVPEDVDIDPASPASMQRLFKDAPPIVYALGKDRRPRLKQMLASGTNLNVCAAGGSILRLSAISGDLEEVRLLLEHGAHPDLPLNEIGGSPLSSALISGKFEVARLLLSKGADPLRTTDGGGTLLHDLAIVRIDDERTAQLQLMIAQELVAAGASVNAQVTGGSTPLMVAVVARNPRLVAFLMQNGANPEIQDKRGATAISLARKINRPDLVAILEGKQ